MLFWQCNESQIAFELTLKHKKLNKPNLKIRDMGRTTTLVRDITIKAYSQNK